jgi:DNA-directed RNA polymerase I, II, and III subunit RPABC2
MSSDLDIDEISLNENEEEEEDEGLEEDEDLDEDEDEEINEDAALFIDNKNYESDNDSDDDSDDDLNYLQKFNNDIKQDIISDYYPELQNINFNEVEALSRVIRNENGVIVDILHKTVPILTKYEETRIIGERAKQINSGATPYIKINEGEYDGYKIALLELEQKKIPFIIKRPLPSGGIEYWHLNDLEVISQMNKLS